MGLHLVHQKVFLPICKPLSFCYPDDDYNCRRAPAGTSLHQALFWRSAQWFCFIPRRDAGILLTFANMLSMAVTVCVSDVKQRHAQVGPSGDGFGGRIVHTVQDDSQLFLAGPV